MNPYTRYLPMFAVIALLGFVLLCPEQAQATSPGGTGLPWETGIGHVVDSLIGPVAVGLVVLGFFGGSFAFATGGEMNGWVRAMAVMLLSGSVMLAAKPFVSSVFGVGACFG